VIGGLMVATLATLLFVPVVFSLLRSKGAARNEEEELEAAEKLMRLPRSRIKL